MKLWSLLILQASVLVAAPCFGQQQLAWPSNPQLAGFPVGHPGIPVLVDTANGNQEVWDSSMLTPGAPILLTLRGAPAKGYLKFLGVPMPNEDFSVPLECRVVSANDEILVAEYQYRKSSKSHDENLVTVTASVLLSQVQEPPSKKWHSPIPSNLPEAHAVVHSRHLSLPQIATDSFKHVRIRVWKVAQEILE